MISSIYSLLLIYLRPIYFRAIYYCLVNMVDEEFCWFSPWSSLPRPPSIIKYKFLWNSFTLYCSLWLFQYCSLLGQVVYWDYIFFLELLFISSGVNCLFFCVFFLLLVSCIWTSVFSYTSIKCFLINVFHMVKWMR